MSNQKNLIILSLFLVLGAAGIVVWTQGVDPTGRATGLAPADGLIDIEYDLAERMTVHPPPGAVDIPPYWDGNEVPQPPAPPQGYPSGPVITVQVQEGDLEIGAGRIMVHGTEEAIPATLLLFGQDPNLSRGTVGLIPHQPLEEATTYRVVFEDVAGQVVADWPFTTGAAQCDPTAQDCGRGQGCYLIEGEPMCVWAGSKMKDEECAFVNACGPGLTCFRGRCQPYCDASPSADPDVACAEQCAQGGQDIPGAESRTDKVCLGQNCLLEKVTCPDKEGCYRFNEVYLCAESGTAKAGEACQYPNDCVAGATCMGIDGSFSCRQLCDGPGMPECKEVCSGGFRTIFKEPRVRYCR